MTTNDPPGSSVETRVAARRSAPLKAPKVPLVPVFSRPPRKPAPVAAPTPEPPSARRLSSIETKIAAAGNDATQILRTLDTELALRRAGRAIKGNDGVKAMRVLTVALLFTLLIAALGAMSYVQTQFIGHGFKHRSAAPPAATAISASPAPGPSTPDAPPARRSAPPTR